MADQTETPKMAGHKWQPLSHGWWQCADCSAIFTAPDKACSAPPVDLSALRRELWDFLDIAKRAIRVLDCGAHYCRYCPAGTHDDWAHTPGCPYEESQKDYSAAQESIKRLTVLLPREGTPGDG